MPDRVIEGISIGTSGPHFCLARHAMLSMLAVNWRAISAAVWRVYKPGNWEYQRGMRKLRLLQTHPGGDTELQEIFLLRHDLDIRQRIEALPDPPLGRDSTPVCSCSPGAIVLVVLVLGSWSSAMVWQACSARSGNVMHEIPTCQGVLAWGRPAWFASSAFCSASFQTGPLLKASILQEPVVTTFCVGL